MRCHICDSYLEEITTNPVDGSVEPCHRCMGVVQDTVEDYDIREEEKKEESTSPVILARWTAKIA